MPESISASSFAPDSDSRPFWEGLAEGELRIQRCRSCGKAVFYPRAICPHCHAEQLEWITASGRGTIYTYTVLHQAFGAFAADVPFVVALIDLEEGVRMMSRITDSTGGTGAPLERVTIGAAVQVTFAGVGDGVTLPYFHLVE
jgi:uncharacterized OB-fold protein